MINTNNSITSSSNSSFFDINTTIAPHLNSGIFNVSNSVFESDYLNSTNITNPLENFGYNFSYTNNSLVDSFNYSNTTNNTINWQDDSYEPFEMYRGQGFDFNSNSARHITFGTTYVAGNPHRDRLSNLINENHMEYAKTWKIKHKVVDYSLLKNKCLERGWVLNKAVDCVPYWNKVALLRNWLNEPKKTNFKEEWYILADDDMAVTNMNVDPIEAIDQLRRNEDTSLIIARDVVLWKNNDPQLSVNTGLFIIRKDEKSKQLIEKLWNKRNTETNLKSDVCKTLGTCQNQDILHEQEAFAQLIEEDRGLLNSVITIVKPRDKYKGKEIALNTFNRWGCFVNAQKNWNSKALSFDADLSYPEGKWRVGDWMGQTAGIPTFGWNCADRNKGLPPGHIRETRIKDMLSGVIKKNEKIPKEIAARNEFYAILAKRR